MTEMDHYPTLTAPTSGTINIPDLEYLKARVVINAARHKATGKPYTFTITRIPRYRRILRYFTERIKNR